VAGKWAAELAPSCGTIGSRKGANPLLGGQSDVSWPRKWPQLEGARGSLLWEAKVRGVYEQAGMFQSQQQMFSFASRGIRV